MAARSKAWVCGGSLAGIAGSNPAGVLDVRLVSVLSFVKFRSLWRADHPSREVLPNVVCLSVIVKPRQWEGLGPLWAVKPQRNTYARGILRIQCKEYVLEAPRNSPIDSPGFHIPQVGKHDVSWNTVSQSSGQKTKAIGFFATLVSIHQMTHSHIPEDLHVSRELFWFTLVWVNEGILTLITCRYMNDVVCTWKERSAIFRFIFLEITINFKRYEGFKIHLGKWKLEFDTLWEYQYSLHLLLYSVLFGDKQRP
jgi:hypothetical protein